VKSLRRTCCSCGSTRRRAYWATALREHVIARCLDCGGLFYGEGVSIPLEWAGPAALLMAVDPGPEGAKAA
jgi:hypothetical protein